MEKVNNPEDLKEIKLVVAVVSGVLILLLTLFISYRNSQKQSSAPIFPGGVTYLGPSPTPILLR